MACCPSSNTVGVRHLSPEIYRHIAQAALLQYRVSCSTADLVGHSDTIVYRISLGADPVMALRIHYPLLNIRGDSWYKRQVVESELMWLKALRRDCAIPVQEPVSTRNGSATIAIPPSEGFGEPAVGSMLTWVSGEKLPQLTRATAHRMGMLTAHLHEHGSKWSKPEGFVRPKYGNERLQVALTCVLAQVRRGLISQEDYTVLARVVERVHECIRGLGEEPSVWGLIHADIHPDNLLFSEDALIPIDFGGCGWGYYTFDIAWAMSYVSKHLRGSFLRGYQEVKPLPENFHDHVDGFLLYAIVDSLAFWVSNPGDQEWAKSYVPRLAVNECRSYLDGEPFFLVE